MKNRTRTNGFSLVELIVAIAIIGILVGIASLNFNSWQAKFNIEKQTKEMIADINSVRLSAMQKKKRHVVTFQANSYVFKRYSSENEPDSAGTQLLNKTLKYDMRNRNGAALSGQTLDIDSRGYITNTSNFNVFVASAGSGAAYDCLSVTTVKVNMGKMLNVSTCQIK